MTWEDKEKSHQRRQDQAHLSPIPALANVLFLTTAFRRVRSLQGLGAPAFLVYQLPEFPSACVSATTVSRDPEKDLLNTMGSTSVPLLQGSPVPMFCLSLSYSRSGFVSARGLQRGKMPAHLLICSPDRDKRFWLTLSFAH